MTQKPTNIVSREIDRLAQEFGYKSTSIASRAFKNSRKAEQLKRRDSSDAAALKKLKALEATLIAERKERIERIFPQGDNTSEHPLMADAKEERK